MVVCTYIFWKCAKCTKMYKVVPKEKVYQNVKKSTKCTKLYQNCTKMYQSQKCILGSKLAPNMLPKMVPNVYLNFLQKDTCKPQNGRFLNRFMTITSLLMKNRWKSIPNLPSHEAHRIPHPKIHLADFWMCAPYLFTFWSFHFLEYQKKRLQKKAVGLAAAASATVNNDKTPGGTPLLRRRRPV